MTNYDDELRRDEAERNNLQKVISDVETAKHVSTPGTRATLEMVLQGARARLLSLEKRIQEAEQRKEEEKRTEAANLSLAERETALSAKERETYGGFLKEDFFTKRDFAKLEEFYAHTWDRLSEHGKVEMSKRIWEGVRRDEYKFTDLPKDVQEKEERQAYQLLQISAGQSANASRIPEQDKADFLKAYEAGSRDDAAKVLNRPSFKANMFPNSESKPIQHVSQDVKMPAEGAAILAGIRADPAQKSEVPAKSIDKTTVSPGDLSGITFAENPSPGAIANLPRPQNSNARGA